MPQAEPRFLPFLDACLAEAVALVNRLPRGPASLKDGDRNQVVTAADRAVGTLLVRRVREAYPDAGVLDEETGAVTGPSGLVWTIDPIDGSSNYAAGSPLYGIMLAALEGGRPVAAGVALPAFGWCYTTESGHGLRRGGRTVPPPPPAPLAASLVAYGLDVGEAAGLRADWRLLAALAGRARGIRMSNSVFDAVMVATGAYGAFVHRRMRIWDIAPLDALVTAAGGACTDLAGQPLDWLDPMARAGDEFAVCLTGPGLRDALRDLTFPFA